MGPKHTSLLRYLHSENEIQSTVETTSKTPRTPPIQVHLRYKARNHVYKHQIFAVILSRPMDIHHYRHGAPVQTNSSGAPVVLLIACFQYGALSA